MSKYFERAKEMIAADIEKHKKEYLEMTKINEEDYPKMESEELFQIMYYESTFKQGYIEESMNDFGYVIYMARIEEDMEDELLEYAIELFKKQKYFIPETDILKSSYYEWEYDEYWHGGAEQILYSCKDWFYKGKRIIVHRDILQRDEKWTIIFEYLLQEYSNYVGSTEMYLKDVNDFIVREKDVNEIVKHAERYIRDNKEELVRKKED